MLLSGRKLLLPPPLLLRSPSLLEVGDELAKVTPAGTVSFEFFLFTPMTPFLTRSVFVDSYGASAPGGGLQRRLQQLLGCESTIVFSCSLLPRGPAFPDDVEISQYAQFQLNMLV